jgi:magnesium-dependent phosphatase-1
VVLDLDDTLWTRDGGCDSFMSLPFTRVSEDTLRDARGRLLHLRPEARRVLGELRDRGVVVSIASFNLTHHVLHALRALGLEDRFFRPQIGTISKREMLRRLHLSLQRRGIGYEQMIFVDDDPANVLDARALGVTALHMGSDIHSLSDVYAYLM